MTQNGTPTTELQKAPSTTGLIRASDLLSQHLGLEPRVMIDVIKAQCFKGSKPSDITNEQLAQFINVANSLRERAPSFNPLLPGMLYAFPTKNGGIEPMIGPDGIFALLGSHPDVEGWEVEHEVIENRLYSATAFIYRRGNPRPMKKTVLLSEWKVGSNPNWNTRPLHMLETRALKQCARQIIHGIPMDPEEIVIAEAMNTNTPPPQAKNLLDDKNNKADRLAKMIAASPMTAQLDEPVVAIEAQQYPEAHTEAQQEQPKKRSKRGGTTEPLMESPAQDMEPAQDELLREGGADDAN